MSSNDRCGQTSDGDTEGDDEIEGSELVEPLDELAMIRELLKRVPLERCLWAAAFFLRASIEASGRLLKRCSSFAPIINEPRHSSSHLCCCNSDPCGLSIVDFLPALIGASRWNDGS